MLLQLVPWKVFKYFKIVLSPFDLNFGFFVAVAFRFLGGWDLTSEGFPLAANTGGFEVEENFMFAFLLWKMGKRFEFSFFLFNFVLPISLTLGSPVDFPNAPLVSSSTWPPGSIGDSISFGLLVSTPWSVSLGAEPVLVLFLFHFEYTCHFFFFLLGGVTRMTSNFSFQ